MANVQEIKRYLPDATDQQAQRFADQMERLEKLQDFFDAHPEDRHRCQEMLARAEKALAYKRPYRIAVIGTTAVGKSTMLNAMLGRDLVFTRKGGGKPATGAELQIFLDVLPAAREKAVVNYRTEANIRQLIVQFLERYHIADQSQLTGQLDAGYAAALIRLEPSLIINEQALTEFLSLRETLADLVMQYTNHGTKPSKEYFLDQESDRRDLLVLTDENSNLNSAGSPQRQVGLIQSVTYHIKPHQGSNGVETLRLPNNVCLVDLPGLDGSPLHDIIIADGIQDADAVMFILRPNGILKKGDVYLIDRVRKYIRLEGSTQSGERIFLVLNARDSMMVDSIPSNLPRDMAELMNLLVPGYDAYPAIAKRGGDQPYFLTSAWAAYHAQKKIRGEQIDDPNTYETIKERLGVKGKSDAEVLDASQVPKLVEELMKFAREHRIEGQIRDSKTAIDRIVELLCREYEREQQQLERETGIRSTQSQLKKILEKQEQKLSNLIDVFGASLLNRLNDWRSLLIQDVKEICDAIDDVLKEKILTVWESAFTFNRNRVTRHRYIHVGVEQVLGDMEVALWHQLAFRFPALTTHLVQLYSEAIEASMLPQKIEEICLGAITAAEIQSKLSQWIDRGMCQKMTEVSERIALTAVTDPTKQFIPSAGPPNSLLQTCKQISQQPKINGLSELEPLLTAIRKHYEPIVSNFCVSALLNLYQYELLLVEDQLFNATSEVIEQLPRTTDPTVHSRIDALINGDPKWGLMNLLDRKLTSLSPIRATRPEPIDRDDQAAA